MALRRHGLHCHRHWTANLDGIGRAQSEVNPSGLPARMAAADRDLVTLDAARGAHLDPCADGVPVGVRPGAT